jgi:GPH family glycoside/pentoside/hexuronide:cation symporter
MSRLSYKEKFGYGLGDTASNVVFQSIIWFMFYFYTDVFGLSAAAVGTLFLIVRIFDGITDPIMGGIADRTNSRWGRYRPYLIFGAGPYALLAILAFYTPELSESGKLIYAYVTYTLLLTAYTAINIPYSALGGVITSSPRERASVQSWRFALAMTGGAVVSSTLLPLVAYLGQGNEQLGFTLAMTVLSIFAVICFIASFYLTKERVTLPVHSDKNKGAMGIVRDFIQLLYNDQWRIIALVTFILLVSVAMRSASTPFYVKYYLQKDELLTLFLTCSMVAGIVGAIAANLISKRICKIQLMKYTALSIVVVNGALFFVPRDGILLALVFTILANFVHGVFTPLLFSTVPDTVDYGTKKRQQSAMGMAFSGHLLSIKIGLAVGGALTGWILESFGYVPNVMQSDSSLNGIMILFTLSSVVAGILVYLVMTRYKLTQSYTY